MPRCPLSDLGSVKLQLMFALVDREWNTQSGTGWDTVVSSCGHMVGMAGWELGVHGCYGTQRDLKLSFASPRNDPSGFSLISCCKITPEPSSGGDPHPLQFPDMRFQIKNQGGAVLGTKQEPPGQVP